MSLLLLLMLIVVVSMLQTTSLLCWYLYYYRLTNIIIRDRVLCLLDYRFHYYCWSHGHRKLWLTLLRVNVWNCYLLRMNCGCWIYCLRLHLSISLLTNSHRLLLKFLQMDSLFGLFLLYLIS